MITVEGVQYGTLKEACDKYGLEEDVVSTRLMIGWDVNIAFEIKKPRAGKPLSDLVYGNSNSGLTKIEYEGVTYSTYGKLARAVGVDYSKLKARLSRGLSIEQSIFDIRMVEAVRKTGVVVGGVKYGTFRKACNDHNIDYDKAMRYLMAGYTVDQVLCEKVGVTNG